MGVLLRHEYGTIRTVVIDIRTVVINIRTVVINIRTVVIDYMNGEPDRGRGVSWWSISSYAISNSESESKSRQVINGESLPVS